MRTTIRFLALALLSAGFALAQSKFSERLTPDERRAAGLDQLSAAQIAALDAFVAREARGPVAASRPAATPSAAGKSSAPAAAPADAPAAKPARNFGLPERDEPSAITGTLVGEYSGWSGATLFRLEDGQIWVQANRGDRHNATPRQNPRVTIEKSSIGGYKLTVEGDSVWVRVRRVQ